MEKKAQAKASMLKELSKEMSDDMYSPMKDMIAKKGMKKVTVASDSSKGLEKGLSMAEKLMKLKAEQGGEESESEEEGSCPMCKGAGCEACSSEMSEDSEDSEEPEMSQEDMEAMYEMLKQKLGK
jgi:hypothetical protein